MTDLPSVSRGYNCLFVLDGNKLTRIAGILQERFAALGSPATLRYEVRLANGRLQEVFELPDLLDMDNGVRNPLVALNLTAKISGTEPGPECLLKYERSADETIRLTVRSPDSQWANQLFAAVEEQVERTLVSTWIYSLANANWVGLAITLLIATLVLFVFVSPVMTVFTRTFPPGEVAELLEEAQNAQTTEEKIDALIKGQVWTLKRFLRPFEPGAAGFNWLKMLFLGLPVLIVLGVLFYLVSYCYPRGVFLWGDWENYYNTLVGRRRTLWTVVVIALLIGIVSNLFVASLPKLG